MKDGENGAGTPVPPQGYYNGRLRKPAIYVLERARDEHDRDMPGSYLLKEQISYVSQDGRFWTVPAQTGQQFETDLASIPSLASWLVPKDGSHTPAALIHDAMVIDPGEAPCYVPAEPRVSREDADRIFREGMQYLGVRLIRRWLMWTAVSIPTLATGYGHYWIRRMMLLPLAGFVALGLFGVPDVFDVPGSMTIPRCIPGLGGDVLEWQFHGVTESSSFFIEVWRFLRIALIGGALYGLLWFRRWRFGLISGFSLSLLTAAMAVPAVTFALYRVLEEMLAIILKIRSKRGHDTGRVRSAQWVETLVDKL